MKVLVDFGKEWERGTENKNAQGRGQTEQQNQCAFFPICKCG